MLVKYSLVFCLLWTASARDWFEKLNYIIACHTTDFICFKRQYLSLRDHVLLGNKLLMIPHNEPVIYEDEKTFTCAKVHGLEETRLTYLNWDSRKHELRLNLEMPLRMTQVKMYTEKCNKTTVNATDLDLLYDFTGNATIKVTFPFTLDARKKRETYVNLLEEELDFILDIPDLAIYKDSGVIEQENEYISTVWAEQVLKEFDAAAELALPYTSNLHRFTNKIPLERYLLLYPEESYHELQFSLNEPSPPNPDDKEVNEQKPTEEDEKWR